VSGIIWARFRDRRPSEPSHRSGFFVGFDQVMHGSGVSPGLPTPVPAGTGFGLTPAYLYKPPVACRGSNIFYDLTIYTN
jgi:hypothetical protein